MAQQRADLERRAARRERLERLRSRTAMVSLLLAVASWVYVAYGSLRWLALVALVVGPLALLVWFAAMIAGLWRPPGVDADARLAFMGMAKLPPASLRILHAASFSAGYRVALPDEFPGVSELVESGLISPVRRGGGATLFAVDRAIRDDIDVSPLHEWDDDFLLERTQEATLARLDAFLSKGTVCAGPPAPSKRGDIWDREGESLRVKADAELVEQITRGACIIMDRKTWDALPLRPLPDRVNIVVERSDRAADLLSNEGVEVVDTLDEAIAVARIQAVDDTSSSIYVIGGLALFRRTLAVADRAHLTLELADAERSLDELGLDTTRWTETSREIVMEKAVHVIAQRQSKGGRKRPTRLKQKSV